MKFISYCWNIGTTSFRVKDLNIKIEQQLSMLTTLREREPGLEWQELEGKYFDLMVESQFIKEKKVVKDKDKVARQKTSALVEIGVLTSEREITEVGKKIQEIVKNEEFTSKNIFGINQDSYLYLKQMLKYQTTGGSKQFHVKPFLVLLKVIIELGYITVEEFTYFLPLCTNMDFIDETINEIKLYRNGKITIDDMINHKILQMPNYRECLEYMVTHDMSNVEEFAKVEMNRKGSRYSYSYCKLNQLLWGISQRKKIEEEECNIILKFLMEEYKKNNKTGKVWREYFKYKRKITTEELANHIKETALFNAETYEGFQKEFFLLMTRAKWKANLNDYYDLNKRFFALTDILLFREDKIELDLLPFYYFRKIIPLLLHKPVIEEVQYAQYLQSNVKWEQIIGEKPVDLHEIYQQIKLDYPQYHIDGDNVTIILQQEKRKQFNELIDREFSEEQLIQLFQYFIDENYDALLQYTDWSANPPTIFEYLIGIAWYRICNKAENLLTAMRLSLDANLYPKSHATGGAADIIWEYEESELYPKHTVLLEATLTKSTNQRKSEIEPVTRHMMRYLQETEDKYAFAVFVAPFLNEEVLSDFRNKKTYQYRGKDGKVKQGLSIVALDLHDIIHILRTKTRYGTIYPIFYEAIEDTIVNDLDWYQLLIRNPIQHGLSYKQHEDSFG